MENKKPRPAALSRSTPSKLLPLGRDAQAELRDAWIRSRLEKHGVKAKRYGPEVNGIGSFSPGWMEA